MLANSLCQIAEGQEATARCPATPPLELRFGNVALRACVNVLESLPKTHRPAATGVCTLSAPLRNTVPSGYLLLAALQYHPLSSGGQANAYSQQTIQGWTNYVHQTCAFVQSIFGNAFDLEVWNEWTFGSEFLDDNNYYSPVQKALGPCHIQAMDLPALAWKYYSR